MCVCVCVCVCVCAGFMGWSQQLIKHKQATERVNIAAAPSKCGSKSVVAEGVPRQINNVNCLMLM